MQPAPGLLGAGQAVQCGALLGGKEAAACSWGVGGHEARGLPPTQGCQTPAVSPGIKGSERVQPRPRGEAHEGEGRTRVWAGHSLSAWLPRPPKAVLPRLPRPPKVLGLLKGSAGQQAGLRGLVAPARRPPLWTQDPVGAGCAVGEALVLGSPPTPEGS